MPKEVAKGSIPEEIHGEAKHDEIN